MNGIDWTEIRVAQLIHALAATVGLERGRGAIERAVTVLGIATEVLNREQASDVLEEVAKQEGMIAITARFVRVRIESGRSLPSMPPPAQDSVPPPSSERLSLVSVDPLESTEPMMAPVYSRRMLISLLTGTLGRELALSAVEEAADEMGLPASTMSEEEALSLLERLAGRPGKVGVTARFAKARLLLRQSG